jgi:hypothetical protein
LLFDLSDIKIWQKIVNFYINQDKNSEGVSLEEILSYSDIKFEACHNFVQWVFPLHEKSLHSKSSPQLSKEDVEILSNSLIAKNNILKALERFVQFLNETKDPLEICYNALPSKKHWTTEGNHNFLRITRIIRSLRLFGLHKEAKDFYDYVVKIFNYNNLNKNTIYYWDMALNDPVFDSMQKRFLKDREIKIQ